MIATITRDKRLTAAEAAAQVGISKVGVLKAVNTGRLPATRCGLGWLFDREDIERFAERRNARQLARA